MAEAPHDEVTHASGFRTVARRGIPAMRLTTDAADLPERRRRT